jgi:peptidoglycan L-alanyl-D-glutamate endopeptidase CwlK
MPKLSAKSEERLKECHPDIQKVFSEVIKYVDFTVTCGMRGEEEQNEAFRTGKSKLKFPQSKHNQSPSLAIDVVPFPIDWNDHKRFYYFAGFVLGIAKSMNIDLRFGGDWDGDFDIKDQNFFDLPHFELKSK